MSMPRIRVQLSAPPLSFCRGDAVPSATRDAVAAYAAKAANPITGEGLPNPAPNVTRNWGELPAGRKWVTIRRSRHRPERRQRLGLRVLRRGICSVGGGAGGSRDNPVDPVFKFDRKTGKALADFGKGVMVMLHGI